MSGGERNGNRPVGDKRCSPTKNCSPLWYLNNTTCREVDELLDYESLV